MTSSTLSTRLHLDQAPARALQHTLRTGLMLLSTLAASRGYVSKLRSADRLLRQSNRVEASQPERAAALRQAAADQID